MATVKFYLHSGNKDGETAIQLHLRRKNDPAVKCSTKRKVHPRYWNKEEGRVRRGKDIDTKSINQFLRDLETHALRLYNQLENNREYSPERFRQGIKEWVSPPLTKTMTFKSFFEDFIRRKEENPKIKTGTCKVIQKVYNNLVRYFKKKNRGKWLDFDQITLAFKDKLVLYYLTEHEHADRTKNKVVGLGDAYIAKQIKIIKEVMSDAWEKGHHDNRETTGRKFQHRVEQGANETAGLFLTIEELDKLYAHDFSNNNRLAQVRDGFILLALTAARISDIDQVNKENILSTPSGPILKFTPRKTSKFGVVACIPVDNRISDILERYDGHLPNISTQKFNDYLKEACKLAGIDTVITRTIKVDGERETIQVPKHQLISSHDGRRTFVSIHKQLGYSNDEIKSMSGHKSTQQLDQYDRVTAEDRALSIASKGGTFKKGYKTDRLLKAAK